MCWILLWSTYTAWNKQARVKNLSTVTNIHKLHLTMHNFLFSLFPSHIPSLSTTSTLLSLSISASVVTEITTKNRRKEMKNKCAYSFRIQPQSQTYPLSGCSKTGTFSFLPDLDLLNLLLGTGHVRARVCNVSQCTLPANCVLYCAFETFQGFRCSGSCIDFCFCFCILQKWLTVLSRYYKVNIFRFTVWKHQQPLVLNGMSLTFTSLRYMIRALQVSHCWFTGHLHCCYPDWLDLTQQDLSVQLSYLQQQLQHLLSPTENEYCVSVY